MQRVVAYLFVAAVCPDGTSKLKKAVGNGGFAMVNVGYDAEVAHMLRAIFVEVEQTLL